MNKKIKMLIQKYDKDMKFENRFDELKDKLDLIPKADIKSEVFTIKRKVMPAYMMMIVLLMLITGIIGLQFGLNSSFVVGPEQIDTVELELMKMADVYERESVYTEVINENMILYMYVGLNGTDKTVILRLNTKIETVSIVGLANDNTFIQAEDKFYSSTTISQDLVTFEIDFINNGIVVGETNVTINLESYYTWLLGR